MTAEEYIELQEAIITHAKESWGGGTIRRLTNVLKHIREEFVNQSMQKE